MLVLLFSVAITTCRAQGKVGVGDVSPGQVEYTAFTLTQTEKVKIDGSGGAFRHDWQLLVYYGWIINSETRKVVWHTARNKNNPDFDYGAFDINDDVTLEKGTYEVYFTGAYHQRNGGDWSFSSVGNFFEEVFNDRKRDSFKHDLQKGMGITLSAPGLTKVSSSVIVDKKQSSAIVSITKPRHNANAKKGFSLAAETKVRVYGIGEGTRDENFDYAWIYDVDKRERVWTMGYHNSGFAGGADKNMIVDETITLPPGNYMVSYATDDSHTYNDWNAMPPHDPQFTGITLWPDSEKDRKNVIAFRAPDVVEPVVQLTRIRDDEHVSKGFTVKSAAEFRVLCLGEFVDNDEADYGWIMNAETREIVWDMSRERREHAGGAEKNRMIEDVIRLEKGDYIVYYSTDGSHAYGDWNSGPPHEQENYGITVWPKRKEDLAKVAAFESRTYKNDKVVVEIVGVRDDKYLTETFTLDKETTLRIFALGEGDGGDMADYGWIKNIDTDKVVWEMTYRNTEHAGGAEKNRLYSDTIILPKGSYKVIYQTDGSHSYRDWNSSPPRDAERYGISLSRATN